jgi:hypothetical protein
MLMWLYVDYSRFCSRWWKLAKLLENKELINKTINPCASSGEAISSSSGYRKLLPVRPSLLPVGTETFFR